SSFVNPAETALDGFEYRLPSADGVSNPFLISYASGPVVGEIAKRSAGQAQALSAPCEVAGQFYPRGDRDWYTFNVKKGDAYWIEVISSRLGVMSDPFMVVQSVAKGPKGETPTDVQEVYDVDSSIGGVDFKTSTRDPIWKLSAGADGTYRVMVRDLFNESGDDPGRIYRLAVRPERPDFRLVAMAVAPPAANKDSKEVPVWNTLLRRGGTLPIRVLAHRRDGFNGEIKLETRGLPAGVSAAAAKIEAGTTSGVVLLSAAENAAAWAGAISIVGTANLGGAEVLREARGASVVRTVADPANEMVFSRMTRDIAIAVSGDESEPIAIGAGEEKVFEGAVGTKVAVPLKIARPGEFKAALKLKAVGPAFLATMKEADVAAGADKGTLEIDTAALKIPVGAYQFYLQTQTAGKYQRKPAEAKAAEDARVAAEKTATALAAEVKKLNEAKAPLSAAAAASGAESKKLADAVAGLTGLLAPAQAALTAAQQKHAAAKAAFDKEPAKAELKKALEEVDKVLAEATAKVKSATEAKEAVEKLAAAVAEKAKKDSEASAAAEKAATEATAKLAEAEKTKTAAIAKAKELAAKDVTATFYSKPILFKIVTPPPATQATTKPTTQPVKK
ncbi:MAG TPA: PPC domain-containing protein, partial [Tepidisphaeraceae bacterium]|nr:PPC domain-containing protein [Tepidisphaeraceae bacterium]